MTRKPSSNPRGDPAAGGSAGHAHAAPSIQAPASDAQAPDDNARREAISTARIKEVQQRLAEDDMADAKEVTALLEAVARAERALSNWKNVERQSSPSEILLWEAELAKREQALEAANRRVDDGSGRTPAAATPPDGRQQPKLSAEQQTQVRARLTRGATVTELAKEFGVARRTIDKYKPDAKMKPSQTTWHGPVTRNKIK